MSDGTRWSPETLRREYGPIGAKSALRQLDRLADLGLVRAQASLNSTNYRLHDTRLRTDAQRFGGTIEFQPAPDAAPAAQPVHPVASGAPAPHSNDEHDAAAKAAAASKHGATLWNVLGEGTMNIHDIAQAANLSLSQTRYGIQRLVSEGRPASGQDIARRIPSRTRLLLHLKAQGTQADMTQVRHREVTVCECPKIKCLAELLITGD